MRKPRIKSNVAYHIYNRGVAKRPLYRNTNDFYFFNSRIDKFCKKYKIDIMSHCLMPNHLHLLLKTDAHESNIAKFMKSLLLSYTLYFNKKYKHSGHVFQGAYKHKEIDTPEYLAQIIEYIQQNPVKKGLVRNYKDWPFLS